MTFTQIATILIMGMFTNNMISVSATGADMAMNRTNTMKNSAIYGLLVTIVIVSSTLINFAVRAVLISFNIQNAALLISLFIIAIIVQICEAVCERIAPRFLNEIKYLAPLLACTCAIVAINIQVFVGFADILTLLVSAIAYSLGITLVLMMIAGIKRSLKYKRIPYGCERVVISLIILFILALAFTAF